MDTHFMQRAFDLAKQGIGWVDPNPLVGAVIVKDGTLIGEGFHARYGEAHAEVNAFDHAVDSVTGATLYVTLEPCSHTGKTPPCTDLIIEKKIARVVCAHHDPNPLVAGQGIARLKAAGIVVELGCLGHLNDTLNRPFFKHIQTKLPYVVMKTAMTADGKIATRTHASQWITDTAARRQVHALRHRYMAIMVGVNTIIYDNPHLTARDLEGPIRQPIRIILDSQLSIPKTAHVVKTARQVPTWVMTTIAASPERIQALEHYGVTVYVVASLNGEVDLVEALKIIGAAGINGLMLEGGGTVNHSALKQGIVDEIHLFIAPKIFGGTTAPTPVEGEGVDRVEQAYPLKLERIEHYERDLCLIYQVCKE